MNIKTKIRKKLVEAYGEPFNSYLEHEYEKKITENLINGDLKSRKEWVTYNQVILELKHNLKDALRVKELQYRLTDKGLPSKSCVEVIEGVKLLSPELYRLYEKIINF